MAQPDGSMSRPDRTYARIYNQGIATTGRGTVAELLTADNAVAQVSLLPAGDGFLLRAWPPNGTAEHGGSNLTDLSCVLRVVNGRLLIESLNADYKADS